MLKKTLLLFIFSNYFLNAFTQTFKDIDSLKTKLAESLEDTNRVERMVDLSYSYFTSDRDSSIEYAKRGLSLAQKLKYKKGIALSLACMGGVYFGVGEYPKALNNFLEALKVCESIENKRMASANLGNIANIYMVLEDYPKSLEYYFKARSMFKEMNRTEALCQTLMNIGETYLRINKIDSALIYINEAHSLAIKEDAHNLLGSSFLELGAIYLKMKYYDIAMAYYRNSIKYLQEYSDIEGLSNAYFGIALLLHQDKSNRDSSLYYAKKAYNFAQDLKYSSSIQQSSELLYKLYKDKNNSDSALFYLSISSLTQDSLFSKEKIRQINIMTSKEEIRQQEIISSNIKKQEGHKRKLQYLGILIFIMSFIILIIAIRKKAPLRIVKYSSLLILLISFEFLLLLLDPYIGNYTDNAPALMLLILVLLALILVPFHNVLEKIIIKNLVVNKTQRSKSKK